MGKPETPIETIQEIRRMKIEGCSNYFIQDTLKISQSTLHKACTDPGFGKKLTTDKLRKPKEECPVKNQNLLDIAADMECKGYGVDYGRYMNAAKKAASLSEVTQP